MSTDCLACGEPGEIYEYAAQCPTRTISTALCLVHRAEFLEVDGVRWFSWWYQARKASKLEAQVARLEAALDAARRGRDWREFLILTPGRTLGECYGPASKERTP